MGLGLGPGQDGSRGVVKGRLRWADGGGGKGVVFPGCNELGEV
jgi:hypothetical protein